MASATAQQMQSQQQSQQSSGAQDAAPLPAAPAAQSSLYVGDLDPEITEAQLFELFSQVGPVASLRVCRDAVTRRSLGYAYVNYNSSMDQTAATRALESLNFSVLGGKTIRIMWSHRDPQFRKSGVGNIFIKNLDKSIDNRALHDTFAEIGKILSSKVVTDANGESKGYGFVHFETEEAAKKAIEKVNGMMMAGKQVYVGPFVKRSERPNEGAVRFTNIYVKNIDLNVSDDELRKEFEAFGEVTSCVIMRTSDGSSKGFGFVNFNKPEDAKLAVDNLNGKKLGEKEIYAGRAMKKGEREAFLRQKFEEMRTERIAKYQGMNLYIKNLVDSVDDDALREEFQQFGTITSAKVMRDDKGKSRGFGFVCFNSPEEATRAVAECQGKLWKGKPLYVALAQRKEVRRAQLEAHHQRMQMARAGGPAPAIPGMFPGAAPPMYYPGAAAMQQPRHGAPGMMGYPMMPRGPMAPQASRGGPRVPAGMGMPPHQQNMMMMNGARGGGGSRGQRGGRGQPNRGGQPSGPRGPGGRGGQQAKPAPPTPPQATTGVIPGGGPDRLTTAILANATAEQQKQMLGERLFPLVQSFQPNLAGKITGMLLDLDNTELLVLLESNDELRLKVEEAMAVLRQHGAIPEEAKAAEGAPAS
uniref:Polyadenylate-binding protein n=1 Tax=Tetraselmis sp. GSL018 TaxID=582737 RepID=A0A061S9W0_9CHLO|mmetsp:Transcript_37516/g.89158  ORF Transcript_37516/g.89158 Transcript_37516/m.89158 type:complete len:641 (+) Transcript_37516:405-2327(+)|eukprot:CAMPEP_0177597482 /NCGR_PEP_ID=MMETSP0419_2-20121207/11733_1 /TAXON_ID=582737 /ORGANISM="Tetraselmis sp., Strain GSL018" /LENGTH=640 /DNA_ID=CAMNT_0019089651 /DNA_START=385 /DNA_END=2307 /DNA_ORIENTATION=-